jgi:RimJ/RimL family protein N-acetyltransferase
MTETPSQGHGLRNAYASVMEIQTDRLLLRRFRPTDLEAFVAYRSEEGVARFQSWDESYSRSDAERFLIEDSKVAPGQPGRAWFCPIRGADHQQFGAVTPAWRPSAAMEDP